MATKNDSANHLKGKDWEFGAAVSSLVICKLGGGYLDSYLSHLGKGVFCSSHFPEHKMVGGFLSPGFFQEHRAEVKFNIVTINICM